MDINWTPVENKLPLQGVEKGVVGEYLVTVELNDPDPNDEPEVMFLWFDATTQQFSEDIGGKPYEQYHSWHVVAWAEKPKPIRRRNRRLILVRHIMDTTYRNLHIFNKAMAGKKIIAIAKEYKLTSPRIKQIVLREAKKRAPKLYDELSAVRFNSCRLGDIGQGPSMEELLLFKDQFLYGDA